MIRSVWSRWPLLSDLSMTGRRIGTSAGSGIPVWIRCTGSAESQKQQQQPQPEQKKDEMSDQVAEQLLNSAQQDEKGVQRKVNKNQNNKRRSLEKDW